MTGEYNQVQIKKGGAYYMNEKKLFELMIGNQKQQIQQIVECNNVTSKFGLQLTNEEALQLLESKKNTLRKEERVEFNEGILPKLIETFCDSPFLLQDNYVEVLEGLQEIFYLYKNESLDELTDDELLLYMKECFDKCEGDLDYLEGTCLDILCRKVRSNEISFLGIKEDEEF